MKKKKILVFGMILLFGFFLIETVFAVGEISYCCEKTKDGALCQNALEEKCDTNYRSVPTSCEATSYCRLGTCIDSQGGTCTDNTPQKVCEENGGVWQSGKSEDIPQCTLGCCLIGGSQAAFVTQTRCKRLSALYGLETNYRTDIQNEVDCIATTTSETKGACVFDREYERTCKFTTQAECKKMKTGSENSSVEFHEGYLCSNEELGTNCGPTTKTTCVEGRDEIYFVDSCGNIANIYDASKISDKNYWSKIYLKDESCDSGTNGNANSRTCGNCDYFSGSVCEKYDRSKDSGKPNYGDNICRDLSCRYEGQEYQHGESWCANAKGISQNLPGSRSFRLVCYNGEVLVEPCADFRQEICMQTEINTYKSANCVVNKWQDCTSQKDEKNCENSDKRDCKWIGDICVPKYPPGFDFWEAGEAEAICSRASAQCVVKFESNILGSEKCVENCDCLGGGWTSNLNRICLSLGDCGSKSNYLGAKGY